jgi:amino acid adenylation domain-containing protein
MAGSTPSADARRSNLTRSQRLIWTGQQLHPAAPLYNMAFMFVVDGRLDEAAMARATGRLIDECDALRTVVEVQDGLPRQRVPAAEERRGPGLEQVDVSSAADPAAAARAWATERAARPFDIARAMTDLALLRLGPERYAWYLGQHHLVTDAWSVELLLRRLESWYTVEADGAAPPTEPLPPFAAHAEREVAAAGPRERLAVAERTAGAGPSIAGPYGRDRRRAGTASRRIELDLGTARTAALRELATRPEARALTADLSLFTVVATALVATLTRLDVGDGGSTPLVLGVPVHQRPTPDLRRTVGLLTEVMPLTVDADPEASFATLAEGIRGGMMAMLMRSAPRPGAEGAGDAGLGTVRDADAVLNFLPMRYARFAGFRCTTEWLHPGHHDREHPLRLQVHDFEDDGRLRILFDLNAAMFDGPFAAAAVAQFERVVDAMIADWSEPVVAADRLDDAGRARAIAAGVGPRPVAVAAATVPTMIAAQVASDPGAVAMACGERTWSYAEFDRRVAALAAQLPPAADGPVGILMRRGPEAVIAMAAAMRAGTAFVPVDPDWPAARRSMVLEDAGASLVLVAGGTDAGGRASVTVDASAEQPGDGAGTGESAPADPASAAYVMFTSGSTGRPKGVQVSHGALASYVAWAGDFYCRGRRLTFPLFTPLTFDLTITSIMVPLATGGTIVIHRRTAADGDLALLDVVDEDRVDIIKLTPSHLGLLDGRDLTGSRVRQLILGGEDLTVERARRARRIFGPDVQVHNEYGPTEATVGCVVHTFDPEADAAEASVPIGRPIAGMQAHVLDERGRPVPDGIAGELHLAGPGLADGYLGRPELTAERFGPSAFDPSLRLYRTGDRARRRPDGVLDYLGRRDEQVKVRGVRIELGEVEAAVARQPGVRACVAGVIERPAALEPADVTYCSRCGIASSYPGVTYDAEGVCDQCRGFETYRDRAAVYFRGMEELRAIIDRSRAAAPSAPYDCIALLSGGKDSTYMVARLVDAGARPLALTLDNGYISEEAKANIRRVVAALGVDHEFVTTPAMNAIFVDSLKRHANVCQGCFKTIYTLSVNRARELGVPLIMTGLSRGQFFETRLTEELFTEPDIDADRIDETVLEARKAYHRVDDAVLRLLDVSAFENDSVFEEVRFVDFYRYCDVDLGAVYAYLDERLPWVRPSDTGRSTNCLINDVGIWYHRRERGFHNYALPYAWDVRMGHKQREAALDELDDEIDEARVRQILREIGFDGELPEAGGGGARLTVWYVPEPAGNGGGGPAIDPAALRTAVAGELPGLMVPAVFVPVDEIPLTANGKVDRSRLPAPDAAREGGGVGGTANGAAPYVAPRTEAERTLAGIWAEVLEIDRIGVHEDFFALGGDSIMAIRIVGRARRAGLALEPRQIFQCPTIASLAAAAGAESASDEASATGTATGTAAAPAVGLDALDAGTLGALAAALQRRGPAT